MRIFYKTGYLYYNTCQVFIICTDFWRGWLSLPLLSVNSVSSRLNCRFVWGGRRHFCFFLSIHKGKHRWPSVTHFRPWHKRFSGKFVVRVKNVREILRTVHVHIVMVENVIFLFSKYDVRARRERRVKWEKYNNNISLYNMYLICLKKKQHLFSHCQQEFFR